MGFGRRKSRPSRQTIYAPSGKIGLGQGGAKIVMRAPAVATPPSALTVTGAGASSISLQWVDASDGESLFYVYRRPTGGGAYTRLALSAAARSGVGSTVTYTDTAGLSAQTSYDYYVTSLVGGIESVPSASVTHSTTAAPTGEHAYYESLIQLPTLHNHWPLRSQASINGVTPTGSNIYFTYNPGADTYPEAQDAAKFLFNDPALPCIPTNQQLKMPLSISGTDTVLITWDFWFGYNWRDAVGNVPQYKIWNVRTDGANAYRWFSWVIAQGAVVTGDSSWPPAPVPAVARMRPSIDNMGQWILSPITYGIIDYKPYHPSGAGNLPQCESVLVNASRWTRWWIELRLNRSHTEFPEFKAIANQATYNGIPITYGSTCADLAGSTWTMMSLWVADKDTGPTRVLYKVPVCRNDIRTPNYPSPTVPLDISRFDFEFNTSSPAGAQTGPFTGYGKNVVALKNYVLPATPEDDTVIFQRPTT